VSGAPISFDGVWKSYPRWQAGSRTLRGMLARRVPVLSSRTELRWALRDVSVEVAAGEVVGVIGQNGAGKSTMLRLASGLGRPTRGRVVAPEATTSILRLGDSFDMELTGRENAVTAAIVAGASTTQARAMLPAALEFAELEDFADAPLRTYSEGMKLRLAFGVLAQFSPDALVVDEVIAVGDMRFQAKCLAWVDELRAAGAAILIASHGLEQVAAQCDRAVWLQAGAVRLYDDASKVVEAYRDAMRSETVARTPPAEESGDGGELELQRNRFGSQEVTIDSVALLGAAGTPVAELASGDSLTVELGLSAHADGVDDAVVSVSVSRMEDGVVVVDATTEADGVRTGSAEGGLTVTIDFERLDLQPGEYSVDVGVHRPDWDYAYDFHWQAHPLLVTGPGSGQGVYRPPWSWRVSRGLPGGAEPDAVPTRPR
jgi:lipopolysaccharide transport system ATP-binding protein